MKNTTFRSLQPPLLELHVTISDGSEHLAAGQRAPLTLWSDGVLLGPRGHPWASGKVPCMRLEPHPAKGMCSPPGNVLAHQAPTSPGLHGDSLS